MHYGGERGIRELEVVMGLATCEADDIQARMADLLKELIGFGLVRVTPT